MSWFMLFYHHLYNTIQSIFFSSTFSVTLSIFKFMEYYIILTISVYFVCICICMQSLRRSSTQFCFRETLHLYSVFLCVCMCVCYTIGYRIGERYALVISSTFTNSRCLTFSTHICSLLWCGCDCILLSFAQICDGACYCHVAARGQRMRSLFTRCSVYDRCSRSFPKSNNELPFVSRVCMQLLRKCKNCHKQHGYD